MELYEDGVEHEKSFDEAVRTYSMPASARPMLVILYQVRAHFSSIYDERELYLYFDLE